MGTIAQNRAFVQLVSHNKWKWVWEGEVPIFWDVMNRVMSAISEKISIFEMNGNDSVFHTLGDVVVECYKFVIKTSYCCRMAVVGSRRELQTYNELNLVENSEAIDEQSSR